MPANRSRTLEWRRCLQQIHERNGVLEIAIASEFDDQKRSSQLVWRVRLLGISDSELHIEPPATLGQTIDIGKGIQLVAVMAIGQNRWMFNTTNLGSTQHRIAGRMVSVLRLVMPDDVQRCQRRQHYRVDAAAITLPEVEMWPLLDPKSVVIAERAIEVQYESMMNPGCHAPDSLDAQAFDADDVMPEVGPKFTALLLNLGGGGVGLRIGPNDAQMLTRHKLFWMRVALDPALTSAVCATGKVVHTHVESNHDVYAGMAFDFSFNPGHQRYVVDQICRYIAMQQRTQVQHAAAKQRKTA